VLIIGIETSGRNGSIALARGEESGFDVIEVVPLAGGTYSAELIPQLSALLERHGLGKQDIDAFAVATGPGSFTGLRVGIATVKGLSEILQRPIAAISILETIAAQSNVDGLVIAALDAGRKELYVGEFEVHGVRPANGRESLLSQMEFAALLENRPDAELITPDTAVVDLASNSMHLKIRQIDSPNSGEIARLGWLKIRAGETSAADVLDANYIRRSDAEIFSKP
jgi:tRNA threonylcarbamoyladenosine biosynthesis protein TsaB